MRIAYFTDTYLPAVNGVVTSLLNISSLLATRKHDILLCVPSNQGKEQKWRHKHISLSSIPSIPSFVYPDWRIASPLTLQLIQTMRTFRPDILHFQTSGTIGGGAILLGKMLKKPVVGSFHGYFMEPEYLKVIGITSELPLLTTALWKMTAAFYNQCSAVVTPAEISKKDLVNHGVTKKVYAIPNTINIGVRTASNTEVGTLRKRYALKDNVILYVGRLSKEKSLDVLLNAFKIVHTKHEHTTLLIIGAGPLLEELKELALQLRITNSVVFTGEIAPEELLQKGYFQTADVFVTPSTSELQPVSIIEAFYFGLPVVGVTKRGTKEMVEKVGLLVPPQNPQSLADAIHLLLSDDTLRNKLSRQSRTAFETKYHMDIVTKQYEKLYQSLCPQ